MVRHRHRHSRTARRRRARLKNENFALREEITRSSMFEEIVWLIQAVVERVLASIVRVARSDSTVLITGETGTGKELIARAVHNYSVRKSKAFIRVNCAAIPASLVASELFWTREGSVHRSAATAHWSL